MVVEVRLGDETSMSGDEMDDDDNEEALIAMSACEKRNMHKNNGNLSNVLAI